jgi:hypothetical protein
MTDDTRREACGSAGVRAPRARDDVLAGHEVALTRFSRVANRGLSQ